jgi:hypothetical protein
MVNVPARAAFSNAHHNSSKGNSIAIGLIHWHQAFKACWRKHTPEHQTDSELPQIFKYACDVSQNPSREQTNVVARASLGGEAEVKGVDDAA